MDSRSDTTALSVKRIEEAEETVESCRVEYDEAKQQYDKDWKSKQYCIADSKELDELWEKLQCKEKEASSNYCAEWEKKNLHLRTTLTQEEFKKESDKYFAERAVQRRQSEKRESEYEKILKRRRAYEVRRMKQKRLSAEQASTVGRNPIKSNQEVGNHQISQTCQRISRFMRDLGVAPKIDHESVKLLHDHVITLEMERRRLFKNNLEFQWDQETYEDAVDKLKRYRLRMKVEAL